MIFGKTKLELKVGIFVFVGMIILAVFILSLGGFKTWTSGYKVNFVFTYVNGVKVGAPVRFAGVDVGEVKAIKFIQPKTADDKTGIKVNCWVKREVKIPKDSTIWVDTLGLLGEKYLEIMPGKDYAALMIRGDEIKGTDPIPMNVVTDRALKIADDVDQTIIKIKNGEGSLGKFITDDTVYNDLEAFVKDIKANPWKLFIKTKEKPAR
jgi:phospholipid/cholesterol/gamma-HCH transport system substrate-binding protein